MNRTFACDGFGAIAKAFDSLSEKQTPGDDCLSNARSWTNQPDILTVPTMNLKPTGSVCRIVIKGRHEKGAARSSDIN